MSQTARYGLQAGLRGIVGIQIGNFIFFLCIAFGLVTLLSAATHAFAVLQLAGAIYLLYLGLRIIISSLWRKSVGAFSALRRPARAGNLVMQGLIVQLTNPKALLFVSALLPQFLDPDRQMWLQIAILLSCTVLIDLAILGSYAVLADRGTHSLHHPGLSKWIEFTFGLALVGLGLRLLDWRK